MTLERILVLIETLMAAVHESVPDVDTREEIAAKFSQILHTTRPRGVLPGRAEDMEEHFQRQIEADEVF